MLRLISVLLFEWLWCLSDLLIKPKMLSYEKGFQRDIRCNRIDSELYQTWKKREFLLTSDYGYKLFCELIEAENKTAAGGDTVTGVATATGVAEKIAVLCHGLGCARYGSIKYAELFHKLGFTVLMYDHRNHGKSGKAFTTMGYYEKYDLKKIVDWCYYSFGNDCKIITHGESMGAATVLLNLEIDKRVSLSIADCAYSDLRLLIRHELRQYYHLPGFLIPVVSCLSYVRAGFLFRQVSPIRAVLGSDTPVLFIHGKRDNLVPAFMSSQMYTCKKKNKGLYLVAGAKHAESYCLNKQGYEKRVSEFIGRYLKE
jgi:uncharacterized protein